jgi:hypothetical protein
VRFTLLPDIPANLIGGNTQVPESAFLGGWIYKLFQGQGWVCVGYTKPYVFASHEKPRQFCPADSAGTTSSAARPQPPPQPTYGPNMSRFDAHAFAEQIVQQIENDEQTNLWNVLQRFHTQNNVQLTSEITQSIGQQMPKFTGSPT